MKKEDLLLRIKELEEENAYLKKSFFSVNNGKNTVSVPKPFEPIFNEAQEVVAAYFKNANSDPSKGIIEINNERYVLLRASSLSVDFLTKIKDLYADKGEEEAYLIGRNFLFDISHVIGMEDAKNFHAKMGVKDPVAKLSAGPVHFAYSGWAFVDILEESNPSPDDNFFLKYHHPYSFEADSWIKSGKQSSSPVCIMNSGYSSGWCEESFGIPLTAVEISCRAKGDDNCTFIMAPPHKIGEYLKNESFNKNQGIYDAPLFFERKRAEEVIRESLNEKNILLKEIHHRVKNNLQVISSLLNLQSNYLKEEEAKLLFKESQNRIKTLALVHEKLYKSEDVEYVNLTDYVSSIYNLLSYSYDKEFIDFQFEFEAAEFEKFAIEKAIPFGLIVNEVLSNSFKYAFPHKLKGKIEISVSKKGNSCFVVIQDNGVGLPEDIDINNSNTLGLELIHSLVDQLDGALEVASEGGTKFQISFPLH